MTTTRSGARRASARKPSRTFGLKGNAPSFHTIGRTTLPGRGLLGRHIEQERQLWQ